MIRIAVVDDDDHDAAVCEAMVRRYFDDDAKKFTVTRFGDGGSLLEGYESKFDIIFLDVEMPGINGLETARRLREIDKDVVLVFTTIMAQYAAAGYDVDAIGYLVKPLKYYGFAMKMRKAEGLLGQRRGVAVPIHSGGSVQYIVSRDIRYVEVYSHEILYHLGAGSAMKAWGSLREVADRLSGVDFMLVSRYCLVNLHWVTGLASDAVTVDGVQLQVSRSKRKPLMQALAIYYGG